MQSLHEVPVSARILDRYEVVREIGRGAQARTFLAIDHKSGAQVALKELDLHRAEDWKSIELFEREGAVLRALDHPGIPDYIDAFQVDDAVGELRFYLAQEFVPGRSLQDRLDAGERLDEAEARAMLGDIFDILHYLHALNPPVVHRDIKPSNIMERPDGSYALIDFGAVQEIVQNAIGGDTVVGTSGFLPPEQLMGRAQPASDLYALGATVVYAMSRVHPIDLPMKGMRLDFLGKLKASTVFERLLEKMLVPAIEERIADVETATEELKHLPNMQAILAHASGEFNPPTRLTPNGDSQTVSTQWRGESLWIEVVPKSSRKAFIFFSGMMVLSFMVASHFWQMGSMKNAWTPFVCTMTSGVALLILVFGQLSRRLVLTPETFRLVEYLGPIRFPYSGALKDLRGLVSVGQNTPQLMLIEGGQEHLIAYKLSPAISEELITLTDRYLNNYNR